MSGKKTAKKKQRFKDVVNEFFTSHGITNPSIYLARRGGVIRQSIYRYYDQADNAVGRALDKNLLDPKIACWFIQQGEDLINSDEVFEPTSIEIFLRPLLEKFYQER